jgi:SAM-dependent methyltransferase
MEASVYEAEAHNEETHWWFVGRRKLFSELIAELGTEHDAPILDAGTSCGTNLRMLRDGGFTNVLGLDLSEHAARFCGDKGFGEVRIGSIEQMPFSDASFDLVLATDVIEHVDDDLCALREIHRVLRPGGHTVITVPAFQSLWGFQDEVSHHKRRYGRLQLETLARQAGLLLEKRFYFNYLLFAPIWLARRAMRLWRPNIRSEGDINTPFVNKFLGGVFAVDVATAGLIRPPFGVSLLLVAAKPTPSSPT